MTAIVTVPTWKTISIGNHKNLDDFLAELLVQNCHVSPHSLGVLRSKRFRLASRQEEFELVRLAVRKLGFAQGATLGASHERATSRFGLALCPAEAALSLRLSYLDQPAGEMLRMAMKTIPDLAGGDFMFRVASGPTKRWIVSGVGDPEQVLESADELVYARQK